MRNIKRDLWETRPDLAKMLLNPSEGHKYAQFSNVKVNFVCPNCGHIFSKRLDHASSIGLSCPICSDNISYANKFMRCLLMQLNVDFIPEFMFDGYKYKYDFYIEEHNMIIEMNGGQHYKDTNYFRKSVKEEQENDLIKENIAKEFGISNYISINCSNSTIDFISNNILLSNLSLFYDMDNIDWIDCGRFASSSFVSKVADLYNIGMTTDEISSYIKVSNTSVVKWLHIGTELNLCEYDTTKSRINGQKHRFKMVNQYDCNKNFVATFISVMDASRKTNINSGGISNACNKKCVTSGGYYWFFVDDIGQFDKSRIIKS